MAKYLTKSKFKIALECPTRLYYSEHKEYANAKMDDPFLEALAKDGFQVGELAKCYHPNGHDIKSLDYKESKKQTDELLKEENVVIFEAAIQYKNLFARVDVLEKIGNKINLIEVKSKSAHPEEFEEELWDSRQLKKGIKSLKSGWKPYLYDVAFQSYVLKNAFPEYQITNYLMCADKSTCCTVDGLNQKFFLTEDERGRTTVQLKGDTSPKTLGKEILCKLPLDEVVDIIHSEQEMSERFEGKGFEGAIWHFAEMLEKGIKINSPVGPHCKGCEFRHSEDDKKSGFNECWNLAHGLSQEELGKPFVFDVWNWRGADKALANDKILMEDLEETDFSQAPRTNGDGLANGERQWLQVEKIKNNDKNPFLDVAGLNEEVNSWVYPLHMIDFETCMVAIPFNKEQRPYQQIAFQFSHHKIHENGTVEHATEYINATSGFYPNFEFVRSLRDALSKDNGSIFRYSNHENTVLCQIREMLLESEEKDKGELVSFIESVTNKKNGKKYLWQGPRDMIDLYEVVKRFYYSPSTHGSNSIKYVLPAILNDSSFLKNKYSSPVYGKDIPSKNFKNHKWIELNDDGIVINPYKTLPPVFDKYDYETLELVLSSNDIANGGASLTAYAMMQFTDMSDQEREKVIAGLLRYCELDTFAMVMIYEHWKNEVDEWNKKREAA